MGFGMAKNLLAKGFAVTGYDLDARKVENLVALGGFSAQNPADVGAHSEIVYVMVMNGAQAREIILGHQEQAGLMHKMAQEGVVILTATIHAHEAREIAAGLENTSLGLLDSPVSGGFSGAQSGTLTMMAAGKEGVLAQARPAMEAVASTIHHVGTEIGMGQTVKACLQSLIGSIFSATFEACTLAAKTGIKGEIIQNVFAHSAANCAITKNSVENIIHRRFKDTGSHIDTMYKDLTIALDLARQAGVPLFTAATAMQLFQAGRTKYPDGDNWVVTCVLEEIVNAKLEK